MTFDAETGLHKSQDGARAMYTLDLWGLFAPGDTTPLVVLPDGDLLNAIALQLLKNKTPVIKRKVRIARLSWHLDMLCDEITSTDIESKGLRGEES